MGVRTLQEDFQRMGLSRELAEDSVAALTGDESGGGLGEDREEEGDVLSIVESYKGVKKVSGVPEIKTQKTGAKYGYDAIHDNAVDSVEPPTSKGNEYRLGEDDEDDDMDEDAMGILEAYKKKPKMTSVRQAENRMKRLSAAGRKRTREQGIEAKKPGTMLKKKRRQKQLDRRGPAKKGYIRTWRDYDGEGDEMREDILENLSILAEAIDKDPTDRFNEFVEAFNHIADIGEILTLRYHEMGEEDLAEQSIELAIGAESILEQMEELGGALSLDDDAALEEALAEGLEATAEHMSQFEDLMEEYEDDDDDDEIDEDEDEPSDLLSAARRIAEAAAKGKGRLKGKAKQFKRGKKKKAKLGSIKRKTSGLTKFEKALTKGRTDIKDPEALGGYLRFHGSFNKATGKSKGQMGKRRGGKRR